MILALALVGLITVATLFGPTDAHGQGCVASAVQVGGCNDAHADPLGFLVYHLQAVKQLSEGVLVATAALIILTVVAVALLVTPQNDVGLRQSFRHKFENAPPVRYVLLRWLALLEKRDPSLAV